MKVDKLSKKAKVTYKLQEMFILDYDGLQNAKSLSIRTAKDIDLVRSDLNKAAQQVLHIDEFDDLSQSDSSEWYNSASISDDSEARRGMELKMAKVKSH